MKKKPNKLQNVTYLNLIDVFTNYYDFIIVLLEINSIIKYRMQF